MQTIADERDSLRHQLALLEEGYGELQSQSARAQGENAQLLLDLHAFEQQNDTLVRQLQQSDGVIREAAMGKAEAEEQLVSTKLVLGGTQERPLWLSRPCRVARETPLAFDCETFGYSRGVL